MSDTSGRLFEMPLACYDLESSCWKTFVGTSRSASTVFSGTLPTSGSMRNGELLEAQMSGRHTDENDSMSSQLLPTPRASHGLSAVYGHQFEERVDDVVWRLHHGRQLMKSDGAATAQRSDDGNQLLDDSLLTLWTTKDD